MEVIFPIMGDIFWVMTAKWTVVGAIDATASENMKENK